MLVVALLCGYLAMGWMVYMGSWQLVLHPTSLTHSGTGLASEHIQFGPDGSGKPQLQGEWLPKDGSAYAVLYLRGADGQLDMADGSQIRSLHDLGLSVLAFDYRGYGESAERPHPSEDRMVADAVSAWEYLTATRHIQPDHVLVFGTGVGVSIGVQLLQHYGPGAGLIAYNADPTVEARVRADGRAKLYPFHLVFHDSFFAGGAETSGNAQAAVHRWSAGSRAHRRVQGCRRPQTDRGSSHARCRGGDGGVAALPGRQPARCTHTGADAADALSEIEAGAATRSIRFES